MKPFFLALIVLIVACDFDPPAKDVTVDFTETIDYAGEVTFIGNNGQGTYTFTAAEGSIVTKSLPDTGTYQICFASTFPGVTALEANGVQYFSSKPCPQNSTLDSLYYLYPYPGD